MPRGMLVTAFWDGCVGRGAHMPPAGVFQGAVFQTECHALAAMVFETCTAPQGQPEAYQLAKSSCLDSVLADRTGLPISLAVLHRAVGRRAGLAIHLANAPGCIINRVVLRSAGDGGSSGTTDRVVYVDVFAGTELDEAAFRLA